MITDGVVRDVAQCREANLSIWATGLTPVGPTKLGPGQINQSLSCGGVIVNPGDVILADEDGAIVVPRHLADEVARDSFEQERLEKFVAIRIGQGKPITGTYPPNDETKALYQAWIKAGEPPNG